MTGVDIIAHVVQEFESKSNEGNAGWQDLINETFDSIKTCVVNIKNTNDFMLMTINRCIDYTKASKGFKLVPKYETLDLMETLSLPLNCMQNIQQKVSIVLEDIPGDICSHIITDKQWLQENVLCLLSNAVKYSSGGEVSISIKANTIKDTENNNANNFKSLYGSFRLSGSRSDTDLVAMELSLSPSRSFSGTSSTDNSPRRAMLFSSFLTFEIKDCGIGVPLELRDSLFNPFKQTQRLAGGTGLGLYSLAKRIEALSGECGVKDRIDGKDGSIFWFSVPYRPDPSVAKLNNSSRSITNHSAYRDIKLVQKLEALQTVHEDYVLEEKQSSSEFPSSQFTLKQYKVLLAEDSPTIAKMTSMMLRKHGHEVVIAENGAIALNLLKSRWTEMKQSGTINGPAYDVILMDLQMPVMDGLEATRRIRDFENGRIRSSSTENFTELIRSNLRQPVIGVSANSDEDTSDAAIAAGIDAFIPKPFKLETFYATLSNIAATNSDNH